MIFVLCKGMLDYCKGNCIIVDGTGGLDAVMQRVFKATLQASPPGDLRTANVDQVLGRQKDPEDETKSQIKPEKSILAMPGQSKSNLRVGFNANSQIVLASNKTNESPTQTSEPKLKSTSSKGLDLRSDSAKPICIETSISGIKPIPKPPVALKKSEELPPYESCTSVFPGEIRTEWGRVRNKLKSYTALPPLKTLKTLEKRGDE